MRMIAWLGSMDITASIEDFVSRGQLEILSAVCAAVVVFGRPRSQGFRLRFAGRFGDGGLDGFSAMRPRSSDHA